MSSSPPESALEEIDESPPAGEVLWVGVLEVGVPCVERLEDEDEGGDGDGVLSAGCRRRGRSFGRRGEGSRRGCGRISLQAAPVVRALFLDGGDDGRTWTEESDDSSDG